MSDRIAVMNKGCFEQIGTPDEIYNHPKTSYVATFVGNANILNGIVESISDGCAVVKMGSEKALVETEGEHLAPGEKVTFAVRSENIRLDETGSRDSFQMEATVKEKNFAGGQLRVLLALSDGTEVTASRYGIDANVSVGQKVAWSFEAKNAVLVDRENAVQGTLADREAKNE